MPGGRPSEYSIIIAEAICEELADGRSLVQICESVDFPHPSTVYRWLEAHEEFREKYARARELQAERYAAEIIALADTERICERRTIKADGSQEVTILDQTDRTRLQIDARKWYASKLAPKKYGDFHRNEVTGPEGGPLQAQITVEFVKPPSDVSNQ